MKRLKIVASALVLIGLLNGCGGGTAYPTTPQKYRDATAGSSFGTKESFVVNRSYSDVASIFQRNSKRCLNKMFKQRSTTYGGPIPSTSTNIMAYSAKFKRGAARSTLVVKENSSSLQSSGLTAAVYGEPPKDGLYFLVADIINKGNGQTQVDIYRPSILVGLEARKNIVTAVRAWSKGTSRACPNISK